MLNSSTVFNPNPSPIIFPSSNNKYHLISSDPNPNKISINNQYPQNISRSSNPNNNYDANSYNYPNNLHMTPHLNTFLSSSDTKQALAMFSV